MINNQKMTDVGFIHDLGSLDRLRQDAVGNDEISKKKALRSAAEQFEAIFTQMLFKSMRSANSVFESDLMSSDNQKFFEQMHDEQMSSELSKSGSLGLADMIVAQLGSHQNGDEAQSRVAMRNAALDTSLRLPVDQEMALKIADDAVKEMDNVEQAPAPTTFSSPKEFVMSMKPYADSAAKALGVEPSLLLAQAALETGWGKKVIKNSVDHSYNLFNIKADRSWQGEKVSKQTLEVYNNIPVKENAAFRSYDNYQASFNDFVSFLNNNPRYDNALSGSNSSESFIRGIHKAGYATDPNYSDKVLNVMKQVDSLLK
ncbi:MAG: flagellar assembly peptidoglycan hydrolase FlgJ [Aliivibrio sp.]|uniref:flagellar assembly peptidoglycan hydrolase FlgJ n=1 Tax=Aliivibrio sp. TaxID=1872443 RepID=UPI001A3B930E|nr:flagellar assembly peptidoglycan hydrolase FlgJ [Aliivibrio sp.]